ncbi:MAG: TetR/AcrR family transcriptional regulator [Gammaproteobacteria bacterium]|nr:TetR/AcrR family transcriptional regulator [Gammaproteobacteria bacterium]
MPDVLHFDVDKALDQMLKVFWQQGFKATTTKQLAKSASLSEGSLFNTFGSKRELYIQTLQRYRENAQFLFELIEKDVSPIHGFRAYWNAIAARAADKTRVNGCMITNATVEQSQDAKIVEFIETVHSDNEKFFKKHLDRAVKIGELKQGTDAKALAQFLQHSVQGIRVLSRTNPSKQKMRNIVNTAMSVLDQHLVNPTQ